MLFRWPLPDAAELAAMYDDPAYLESAYFRDSRGERGGEGPEIGIYREAARRVEALLGRPPRALDVGCGSGVFLDLARRRGWRVEGVELSAGHARAVGERLGIPVHAGDFLDAPLPRASFDAVSMWDLLEHVNDPRAVLARARELLTADGRLVILTIDSTSLFNRLAHTASRLAPRRAAVLLELLYDARHNYYFSGETLEALLGRCGFAIEQREPHRAYLGRWLSEPAPWWVRAPSHAVDALSTVVGREYRQLLICRAA